MSSCSQTSRIESQPSPMYTDATSPADQKEAGRSYARDLFTYQTGQILLEIGSLFISVPPFNEHVDRNTGALLISIGNKLKSRK